MVDGGRGGASGQVGALLVGRRRGPAVRFTECASDADPLESQAI